MVGPGDKPIAARHVAHALAPQDYAVIYNISRPAYNPWTGSGVTIGLVGSNDLYNNGQDVQNFLSQVGSGMNSLLRIAFGETATSRRLRQELTSSCESAAGYQRVHCRPDHPRRSVAGIRIVQHDPLSTQAKRTF